MSELNLPIFSKVEASDILGFIDYWSKLYVSRDEWKYQDNINFNKFSPDNLRLLFEWKNGSVISAPKFKGIQKNILSKLDTINGFKSSDNFNVEEFKVEFISYEGIVWKLFLLHIIKPNEYPIYDQHVHRAYNYMKGMDYERIKNVIPEMEKWNFYFDAYLPFVQTTDFKKWKLKELDEAFFAFGQFLNTGAYKRMIV